MPDEIKDEESNTWFTLQGIVMDMWNAYKFEPYKSKIEMLFKSVDFSWDKSLVAHLNKHAALRNCVQHHNGKLDNDTLQQYGVSNFSIKNSTTDIILEAWGIVVFTQEELEEFCRALIKLADEFGKHVWVRVPSRYYVSHEKA